MIDAAWSFVFVYALAHGLIAVGGAITQRRARGRRGDSSGMAWRPAVSLVIAVHRVSERTDECLRSLVRQDYAGPLEFVFAAQDPDDPVLPVVERLLEETREGGQPPRSGQLRVARVRAGYTAAASNFDHGTRASGGEVVVHCADDVIAEPWAVSVLVDRLQHEAHLVSALPVFTEPEGLTGRIYAQFYNLIAGFAWATAVEAGGQAAWGGMLAMRRHDLDAVGGLLAMRGRFAEDLVLARAFADAGLRCAIGPVVRSPVRPMRWDQLWSFFCRVAAMGSRQSPAGAIPTLSLLGLQYSYWAVLAAGAICSSGSLVALGASLLAVRVITASAADAAARGARRIAVEFPLADLLHAAALVVSIFASRFEWAGVRYTLGADGTIVGE